MVLMERMELLERFLREERNWVEEAEQRGDSCPKKAGKCVRCCHAAKCLEKCGDSSKTQKPKFGFLCGVIPVFLDPPRHI